jgi:hypothetical protein
MAYVYLHKTNTDDTIFYVGIGDDDNYKRSRCVAGRSDDWKEMVSAGNGFVVQILYDNLTYDRALELEIETIAKIGRRRLNEGPLVNLTAGGQGRKGIGHSPETIQKIVNSEGYKNRNVSRDTFKNKTYEEIYGELRAKEIKQKQSSAERPPYKSGIEHHMYGKKRPEHSAKLKGRPNLGIKAKLSEGWNPMNNPETRKKLSDSKKGVPRPKLVCPYCGKEGGSGNMQRWHFDNCDNKF